MDKSPVTPRSHRLSLTCVLIVLAAVFAALYMVTFVPRQTDIAAILSGLLGGAVVFLLLKEVDERRKRRRR